MIKVGDKIIQRTVAEYEHGSVRKGLMPRRDFGGDPHVVVRLTDYPCRLRRGCPPKCENGHYISRAKNIKTGITIYFGSMPCRFRKLYTWRKL